MGLGPRFPAQPLGIPMGKDRAILFRPCRTFLTDAIAFGNLHQLQTSRQGWTALSPPIYWWEFENRKPGKSRRDDTQPLSFWE